MRAYAGRQFVPFLWWSLADLVQRHVSLNYIQWNPSCEATPFASEKWPFKRGGLLSGVEINTIMFWFTLWSGLSRGGGLSSGWPLKRGSTVHHLVYCCSIEYVFPIGHIKVMENSLLRYRFPPPPPRYEVS